MISEEQKRLDQVDELSVPRWQKWGPYVSERSWGTVREDYSENGDFWSYFPHDQAISRAYRWGEDGIAGWCDRYQILVFAPAFWNGKDPILKERLFGLSPHEGNHGEDVKEVYYHLDGAPTHSYMKYLYKYPQGEFPYRQLIEENKKRTSQDPEYELIDTGIFSENKYFDLFIEYAKASPEDTCIRIQAFNRGKEKAVLHILGQLWFRNQWSWGEVKLREPSIIKKHSSEDIYLEADDSMMLPLQNLPFQYSLGKRYLYGPKGGNALLTKNETRNLEKEDSHGHFKDGFNRSLIHNEKEIESLEKGTKGGIHYLLEVPANGEVSLYFRLTDKILSHPFQDVAEIIEKRKKEADEFYKAIHPKHINNELKAIQRQAFAGILWNKQIYLFDVNLWLKGDNSNNPPPGSRLKSRNIHWQHLNSMRILTMPDKWEFPFFCAWDQAFHALTLALVDIKSAKDQLWLLLFDQFQHPNGQIPALEEEYSQINPPIQGWAALEIYQIEKNRFQRKDTEFLKKCFHKLLINFSWWINKVDTLGFNVFEGGFLGLDNITIIDRSQKNSSDAKLQQSDGTGWMAMFCLNLMRIALELSETNRIYESLATKFFQHFVYIVNAMRKRDNKDYEMWSETDGFFYDVLCYPNGTFQKFRVRSLVGIIPLFAVEYLTEEEILRYPEFSRDFKWFMQNRVSLVAECVIPIEKDGKKSYLLSIFCRDNLKSVLTYIWKSDEFRGEYGLRSVSKFHLDHPFVFDGDEVKYEPGHSIHKINGGNSNWRGPVWIPTTFLLIGALKKIAIALQDNIKIKIEHEQEVTPHEMADSFAKKIINLFSINKNGVRPCMGEHFPFKNDPHWKDYLLFYDFFHGETGEGLGSSHQTGWSALVANLINDSRTS